MRNCRSKLCSKAWQEPRTAFSFHLHQGPSFSTLISALVELEMTFPGHHPVLLCNTKKSSESYFSSVCYPETLPMMWADSVPDHSVPWAWCSPLLNTSSTVSEFPQHKRFQGVKALNVCSSYAAHPFCQLQNLVNINSSSFLHKAIVLYSTQSKQVQNTQRASLQPILAWKLHLQSASPTHLSPLSLEAGHCLPPPSNSVVSYITRF